MTEFEPVQLRMLPPDEMSPHVFFAFAAKRGSVEFAIGWGIVTAESGPSAIANHVIARISRHAGTLAGSGKKKLLMVLCTKKANAWKKVRAHMQAATHGDCILIACADAKIIDAASAVCNYAYDSSIEIFGPDGKPMPRPTEAEQAETKRQAAAIYDAQTAKRGPSDPLQ